jgi:hypothetical protein
MWPRYVCILARPPPAVLRVCFNEGKGPLLRDAPSRPFDGRRVVPLAASGAVPVRGPIPLPSTFPIVPCFFPERTL